MMFFAFQWWLEMAAATVKHEVICLHCRGDYAVAWSNGKMRTTCCGRVVRAAA